MRVKHAHKFQWGFEEEQQQPSVKASPINPCVVLTPLNGGPQVRMSREEDPPLKDKRTASLTSLTAPVVAENGKSRHAVKKTARHRAALWTTGDQSHTSSHKPYAASSLWKPGDLGKRGAAGGGGSRQTFLTLTPVGGGPFSPDDTVGHAHPKTTGGLPLISMTPPLKADLALAVTGGDVGGSDGNNSPGYDTSRSQPYSKDAHPSDKRIPQEVVASDTRPDSRTGKAYQNSGCPLCAHESWEMQAGHHRQIQTNGGNEHFILIEDAGDMRGYDKHTEFSMVPVLPGIKLGRDGSAESENSTANYTLPSLSSSESDTLWQQPRLPQNRMHLTHDLWENPKLSRRDTLLDSLSDRNLLDQKTLFSRKVDASYSRIAHENTVILPPVECNRTQRDVPTDSSCLLERQYVRDVLAHPTPGFREAGQKLGKHTGKTAALSKHDGAGTNQRGQKLGFETKPTQSSKKLSKSKTRATNHVRHSSEIAPVTRGPTQNKTNNHSHLMLSETLSSSEQPLESRLKNQNEQVRFSDPYFSYDRPPKARPTELQILKKLQRSRQQAASNSSGQCNVHSHDHIDNNKNGKRDDSHLTIGGVGSTSHRNNVLNSANAPSYVYQLSDTNTTTADNKSKPYFKQTRFRLPAENSPGWNKSKAPLPQPSSGSHYDNHPNPYTAAFRPARDHHDGLGHVGSHFCDVLGKHSCSQCHERRARELRGHVTGSIQQEDEASAAVVGEQTRRSRLMSPPPAPSPSPTAFLPIQALHKVVIRVKDERGVMAVSSVGVNEDVVRRTTV